MKQDLIPLWLAGEPLQARDALEVRDKYDGRTIARVARADAALLERAIAAAVGAAPALRRLAAYERRDVLLHCVRRFEQRAEELAQLLCSEAGKPIRDSRGEVAR